MRRRTGCPAGTPCDRTVLTGVYTRQFRELAHLRRHIFSLLPLRKVKTIFEPGCGTGLLAREITDLSDAVYTAMDIDPGILPDGECYFLGDALDDPPEADLYISSFFFSSVPDPVNWLRKVRERLSPGGLFTVIAEYDYEATSSDPDEGMVENLLEGLRASGLHTGHGARLGGYFRSSGFTLLHGGEVQSTSMKPDRDFLSLYLPDLPELLPSVSWRIVWGIWRNGVAD